MINHPTKTVLVGAKKKKQQKTTPKPINQNKEKKKPSRKYKGIKS